MAYFQGMKNLIKGILKRHKSLFVSVYVLSLVLFSAGPVFASTPSLGVFNNSGSLVQINVNNADANYPVNLYYNTSSSSNIYITNLGTTNSSGYFSTTLNYNSYSIPQNAYVYVIVNGQSSNQIIWPSSTYNQSTYLSQSNININVGQGQSIAISGSGSYSLSSNSNPTAISSIVSGSTLNVYGSAPGSGTLNVCSTSGSGGCATLYVTVGNYINSNTNYTGYTTYTNGASYNGYPYGYTYSTAGYNSYNNQGRVLGASTGSSIYLSQIPSTGISFANLKTTLFMVGLLSWSVFAAYIFTAKKRKILID